MTPRRGALLAVALLVSVVLATSWRWTPGLPRGDDASSVVGTRPAIAPQVVPGIGKLPAAAPGATIDPNEVRVAARLRRAPLTPTLPSAPLADWHDEYRARAEAGDARASYMLAIAYRLCANVLPDEAAVRARMTKVMPPEPNSHLGSTRYAEFVQGAVDANTANAKYCTGVTKPTARQAWSLLEQAVQLGELAAVPTYLWSPPHLASGRDGADFTEAELREHALIAERQRQVALEAQEHGSEQAILWLAWQAHTNGGDQIGAGDAPSQDPVGAYAGFLAYKMIRAATNRGLDHGTDQAIALYERQLRPDEADAAIARALELVSDPECCLVLDL